MPAFSCQLQLILDRPEWSGVALARACGVHNSQVTRWKNGESWPDRRDLGMLVTALPNEAAGLIAAWVEDLMPQESKLVSIQPRGRGTNLHDDAAPYHSLLGNAPRELHELLTQIGNLAVRDDDLLNIVKLLHKVAQRSAPQEN